MYITAKQEKVAEAQFVADSKLSIQALRSNLHSNSVSLNSLKAFSHASQTNNRTEFEEYVTPLLSDHPSLLVYGWLPKIRHSERELFEEALSGTYQKALTIRDGDGKGNFTPAVRSDIYFPVSYGVPDNVTQKRIGVDVASLPVGGPAIKQAIETRELAASGPINYTVEFGENSNVMLFNAVFEHSDGDDVATETPLGAPLKGLVMALFRVGDLIENQFNSEKHLIFHIQDVTEADNIRTIYGVLPVDYVGKYEETFTFAGRDWNVTSTTNFTGFNERWVPTFVLVAGMILTSMLAFGLYSLVRRQKVIEGIVEDRTRDLNTSVEKLLTLVRRQKVVELELETKTNKLNQVVDKLARSNEELARFAFVCSHDIQEPLRTIRTFSEMLEVHLSDKAEENDEESIQYLGFIKNGAARAQDLIRDILAYSRIDNDAIKPESFDVESVVDDIIKDIEPSLKELGAQVTRGGLPSLKGNKTQIYQLFQNLVGNALKYQSSGIKPFVKIDCEDKGAELEFAISDNGIGIEEHQLTKIFEVFERLNSQKAYAGTGIGLSICKKVVERHGGKIWAESVFGEGSTFRFTIPKAS